MVTWFSKSSRYTEDHIADRIPTWWHVGARPLRKIWRAERSAPPEFGMKLSWATRENRLSRLGTVTP